jgi:hypothetical protein
MSTMSIRGSIKWGLAIGLLIGASISAFLTCSLAHPSRSAVYGRLHVGMTRDEAVRFLRADSVECGIAEPAGDSSSCHFSDFRYLYAVWIDPRTGLVSRKMSVAKPDPSSQILRRAIR